MALTPAEKQNRYRENLKVKGLYQAMKAKHAARMKTFRHNLTGQEKQDYDEKHVESQKKIS